MFTKTKLALAAALIFGAASAVQAASENDGGNETGGYRLGPMGQHFGRWIRCITARCDMRTDMTDMTAAPLPSLPATAGTGNGIRRGDFARRAHFARID